MESKLGRKDPIVSLQQEIASAESHRDAISSKLKNEWHSICEDMIAYWKKEHSQACLRVKRLQKKLREKLSNSEKKYEV